MSFRRIAIAVVFGTLFVSQCLLAQPAGFKPVADPKAVKAKIDAASSQIKTIRSEFSQEKKLSVMTKKITSKGLFLYKRENQLRLEYKVPFEYCMVVNQSKVYIKDEGKVSTYDAQSNKLFKQINTMILASIQGQSNTKDFKAQYLENDKNYLMILTPQSKAVKDMLKSLEIYLDKKDGSVVKFDMVEPNGDYTSIVLLSKELNVSLGEENFILK